MSQLTFKEFCALSEQERTQRVFELSDHDRFLVRMNEWPSADQRPVTDADLEALSPKIRELVRNANCFPNGE